MARHVKQSFIDRSLVVDGNEYIECSFLRCELIFAGGTIPTLDGNDFDSCLWKFDGPAARAVLFMGALYSGGWQALIDATFDGIRGKPSGARTLN